MILLHIIAIICTGLTVLYTDEKALGWVLGKTQTLSRSFVDRTHVIVSVGLATIIATGGLLFLPRMHYLLNSSVFLVKMCFVGALIVNGFFIDRLAVTATERPFASLSAKEKLPLLISGTVSVVGWIGAALCGLLL